MLIGLVKFRIKKLLTVGKKKKIFIKNMTEFERFGLSGKKKLREAETLTRQIKRIVLHFSPILFIQYKYRHNSFVSIFLFYINKVNPIPFG